MYKLFKRSHVPGIFEVQMSGACDTGIARDHNEDAIAIQEDDGRGYHLAIVCDGMGGHSAGEIASAIAVQVIGEYLGEHFGQATPDELLRHAFTLANERIDDHALANPNAQGMGCTCVAVLGIRDHFWVAHAGDSRAYRVREGNVEQLTVDHTMVQELVSQGLLKPEQAAVHPYRGRISRCLGHGQQKCDADITEHTLEHGDNLLLCSDGLSDVVGNPEIAALVGQRDVRDASRRLIEAANKAGGPDNISAIVMRRVV
ncbi:MAG: Stp1/IreP family PP2C-type Ser/Thr phosphatase [Deltaproteobacteria bacterium]|jgi:serine/threonine protein phosphatase PrpC|nr:Stp1/IreP family PP2C-type Ser/Thr phosphatase [Deltaproteobacteria bacterium]MBK8234773.1 Stp1/IreP family PP2C-type Ser/Thr phosphatase [Deltaproteobacteria bacterium]MBK8715503.1 Stp1/IreP family PP2C-type Ser/Thr phosphatase [Deltaproteobacteria bacterium]MBP7288405.1 Stp1/IreP family PP2C-type Ser/Thr phosphatase [Nannocystaceae bacterium]